MNYIKVEELKKFAIYKKVLFRYELNIDEVLKCELNKTNEPYEKIYFDKIIFYSVNEAFDYFKNDPEFKFFS